ncbi:MAG: hypothetical protein IV094_21065 [Vitreoscilla sp.]|nr:hypothetical protein [Vitreoscilla sp.]
MHLLQTHRADKQVVLRPSLLSWDFTCRMRAIGPADFLRISTLTMIEVMTKVGSNAPWLTMNIGTAHADRACSRASTRAATRRKDGVSMLLFR